MSSITVIILAGGSLSGRELGPANTLSNDPRWLPAGPRLAIDRIVKFYSSQSKPPKLILVHDKSFNAQEKLPEHACPGLEQFSIEPQLHIGDTLKKALELVTTEWVLVNPITSLPSVPAKCVSSIQIGDKILQQENWSSLSKDLNGKWESIPKSKADPFSNPTWPFTGIVTANRTKLIEMLNCCKSEKQGDLLEIVAPLLAQQDCKVVKGPWKDLGHRATYALSVRNEISCRNFNSVSYCAKRDLIIKSSSDRKRLNEEKAYLTQLPSCLRQFFPSLIDSPANIIAGNETLLLEALPFPTLAELFLHWKIGTNAWLAIFDRLKSIQEMFSNVYPSKYGSASWLYSHKLRERWCSLEHSAQGPIRYWLDNPINLNEHPLPSLNSILNEMLPELESMESNSKLQLIHGDFCFNNILCEPLTASIRLIDPRGEQQPTMVDQYGIGDYRYDLIKLNHSIEGLYDSTVNNLFTLKFQDKKTASLSIYKPEYHSFIERAFKESLLDNLPSHERKLLTASLFLSMLPLHSDDIYRQFSLAATGVLLLQNKFPLLSSHQ